ncbi:TPR end-of-group domain-containing protein [Pyxidicoccus sp. 3LG]
MDLKQLQQWAVDLLEGTRSPAELPAEVKKLTGGEDTAMKAAHRLFAHVPVSQAHAFYAPYEVGACRAVAAWFSGQRKAAEKVFADAAWKKLSEKQRWRMYDVLVNRVTGDEDSEEAVEEVAAWVLKQVPAHPLALKVKAVLIIRSGRPRAAVPLLEKALKANPEYPSGWYNLACAWSLAGEKAPMLEALKKAIEYGEASRVGDYREEALSDSDFERWSDDADFNRLVRPMAEVPGAEELRALYKRERFDAQLSSAAALMEKHPEHSETYAEIARQSTRAVVGDLDEHGDANAEDYGLGGADVYQALGEALSDIEGGGGSKAVKRFAKLLEKAKGTKPAVRKKVARPVAVKKKGTRSAVAKKKGAKRVAGKKKGAKRR